MTRFELFDHTADIGIRAIAPTLAGLVEPAARGLYAVIGELIPQAGAQGEAQSVWVVLGEDEGKPAGGEVTRADDFGRGSLPHPDPDPDVHRDGSDQSRGSNQSGGMDQGRGSERSSVAFTEGGSDTEGGSQLDDAAVLLRDYLTELLTLFDRDRRMAVEHTVREFRPGRLAVEAKTWPVDEERSAYLREVKAVTYHELAVREIPGGYEARIIVDI